MRNLIKNTFPSFFNVLKSLKTRWSCKRRFGTRTRQFRNAVFGISEPEVLTGPFRGLRYIDEAVWGPITPKWMGSYEAELHAVVYEIQAGGYDTIIDVGSAEGYYAVGLAFICKTARMTAFDSDFISRGQVNRLAFVNSLHSRVSVRKLCTHQDLTTLLNGRSLLVCDIEGFERELLDPSKCLALSSYDILVELHDPFAGPSMESIIAPRFSSSHSIVRIQSEGRTSWVSQNRHLFPNLSEPDLIEGADEYRAPEQAWLWMKALREPG